MAYYHHTPQIVTLMHATAVQHTSKLTPACAYGSMYSVCSSRRTWTMLPAHAQRQQKFKISHHHCVLGTRIPCVTEMLLMGESVTIRGASSPNTFTIFGLGAAMVYNVGIQPPRSRRDRPDRSLPWLSIIPGCTDSENQVPL
jgi:hypothetical protein